MNRKQLTILGLLPIFFSSLTLKKLNIGFDPQVFDTVVFVLLMVFIKEYLAVSKSLTIVLLYIIIISVLGIFSGNNSVSFVVKQSINIAVYYSFYFFYIKFVRVDLSLIIKIYIRFCVFGAAVAIFQYIAYQVGIKALYDYSWIGDWRLNVIRNGGGIRINGFFSEPSFLGYIMTPALYVVFYNLFNKTKFYLNNIEAILIVVSIVLTQSTVAYMGIALCLFLNMNIKFNFIKRLIGFIIILSMMFVMYTSSFAVRRRVDDMLTLSINSSNDDLDNVNISTFTLINSMNVAWNNFSLNPIIGNGVGSHGHVFNRYTFYNTKGKDGQSKLLNVTDANSFFIRIFSEFAFLGIFMIFIFFLINFLSMKKSKSVELYVINKMAFVYLLLTGLRMGVLGFQAIPLMVWIYVYSKKSNLIEGDEIILNE